MWMLQSRPFCYSRARWWKGVYTAFHTITDECFSENTVLSSLTWDIQHLFRGRLAAYVLPVRWLSWPALVGGVAT